MTQDELPNRVPSESSHTEQGDSAAISKEVRRDSAEFAGVTALVVVLGAVLAGLAPGIANAAIVFGPVAVVSGITAVYLLVLGARPNSRWRRDPWAPATVELALGIIATIFTALYALQLLGPEVRFMAGPTGVFMARSFYRAAQLLTGRRSFNGSWWR